MAGILGGLMFLAGGWFMRLQMRDGEVVTDGVVVECEPFRQYATQYYRIVLEFRDRSATRRRLVLGDERTDMDRGARIRVGYLPHEPEETARRVDGSVKWTPWFAMGLGASALVVTVAGLVT